MNFFNKDFVICVQNVANVPILESLDKFNYVKKNVKYFETNDWGNKLLVIISHKKRKYFEKNFDLCFWEALNFDKWKTWFLPEFIPFLN